MANYVAVEKAKLQRVMQRFGKSFAFKRFGVNDYNEPDVTKTTTITVTGIFHETSNHITLQGTDAAVTKSKPSPMIISCWDEYSVAPLQTGDTLTFQSINYRVSGVKNLNEENIAAEISLEVV